ncbi:MAG: UDP-3-O-(3-hydroxymyristoyl)glucosamine N-acyltransferase [Pseudomonadota bacterium]
MPVDHRFYDFHGERSLAEICDKVDAEVDHDSEQTVSGVGAMHTAGPGDLIFFEGKESDAGAISAHAAACFTTEKLATVLPENVVPLICDAPRRAHMQAARLLFTRKDWTSEGSPPAVHETARVAPTAVIGAGAAIGPNSVIGPGAVIGPGVQIGYDCVIGPNATIQCALIGNGVKIYAGAHIGETGFGVLFGDKGPEDVSHWGRAILQDHVTIGAGSCVDRGVFEDTIIGEGTKLDNVVQIAHNAVIGRNCLFASFTGISGSTSVGDGVIMGGRVGIADHLKIGDGAVLTADAGVMTDVPAGETWGGRPAKPFRQFLREVAWLQRQVKRGKKPAK